MKRRVGLFFLYLVFWYLLFVLARILFLICYASSTVHLSFLEILNSFRFGFRLDIAIAAYISFLPSLILSITSFFKNKFHIYFYHVFTYIALLFCSIIIIGDLFLYQYWGFRMDATPLFYLKNLDAATASVSRATLIGGIVAVLAFSVLLFFLYYRIFNLKLHRLQKSAKAFIFLFPLTLLLVILMRGGIGIASLSTSTAYFSDHPFANHAAINPVWNVGFSLSEANDLERKYVFFDDQQLTKYLRPLQPLVESNLNLLRTTRPNIILIITESLTAKAVQATGGRSDVMPQLDLLVHEGILFNHIYAASDRTDKGLSAVLAGYPSLPGSSPLKYAKLTEKLAYLPKILREAGYHPEFYYGGTIEFANYKSFLIQGGFRKIISDVDYPSSDLETKWGAYDHVVFNKTLDESSDHDSMFFKTILTLTSHEPFQIPTPPRFQGTDMETKYLNSLNYTDGAIGDFVKCAKQKSWWKNTLLIIIADHGSRLPGNSGEGSLDKYHIPMLWLGGALRIQDTVITTVASQTDLAATLLSQLRLDYSRFTFSKNILNKAVIPYAFFTFSDGFGFYKSGKLLIYNTITNTYYDLPRNDTSFMALQGKAYLQHLYLDSFNKNK